MTKISKAELTVISAEVMGWRVDGMYLFRPCSLPGLTETRSYLWLQWNPLEDWNQTMRLKDYVADKMKAEWNLVSGQWRLVKYEQQFPCVISGASYEDERLSLVMASVEAATGVKYELED